MTNYCECGGKIALSTAYVYEVEPDQEPFDNGFIEEIDDECGMGVDQYTLRVESPISLVINSCVECGKIFNAEVTDNYNEKYSKIIERSDTTQEANK